MARTEVGIWLKAHDQASRELDRVGRSAAQFKRQLLSLAAGYISLRSASAAIRAVTDAAIVQETAERKLASALALTNDATAANLQAAKRYAAELQTLTTYGDEQILQQMAYAKTIGVSTEGLGEATVAAIGLAAAYDKDLATAMRLVALAAKGETGQLKEMGIIIDASLPPMERYNELLRQGTEKFRLAYEATKDTQGATEQLKNTWGDTKEVLGNALLPQINKTFGAMNDWLSKNQSAIRRWSQDTIEGVEIVVGAYRKLQESEAAMWNRLLQKGEFGGLRMDQGGSTLTRLNSQWMAGDAPLGPRNAGGIALSGLRDRAAAIGQAPGQPPGLSLTSSQPLPWRGPLTGVFSGSAMAGIGPDTVRLFEELLERQRRLNMAAADFGAAWGNAFEEFAMGAVSAGEALRMLATDLQRFAIRQLVTQPLADFMSQTFKDIFGGGTTASAAGNVFGPGGLQRFGLGGVVGGPAMFGFRGGTGLMGEAGAEAIMPLQRDRSGRLGVIGAPPRVAIQVINHGQSKQARVTSPRQEAGQWVIGVVLEDLDYGGPLARRLGA